MSLFIIPLRASLRLLSLPLLLFLVQTCLAFSSNGIMTNNHHIHEDGPVAVLFDMDGTLLDSETLGCKAVYLTLEPHMSSQAKQEFAQRGYLMEWPLKQQTLGLPGRQWSKIVLEWAVQRWGCPPDTLPSVDDFLDTWDGHMHRLVSTDLDACKGAKELVANLATLQIPMAIATSSHSKSVQQKRTSHEDMFQRFRAIVSTDNPAVVNGKPAPDIYLHAASLLNVDPSRCVVVEDGIPGVKAGKAAGCFVVAVPDPRFEPQERQTLFEGHADVVLDNLTQFQWHDIIQKMKERQQNRREAENGEGKKTFVD